MEFNIRNYSMVIWCCTAVLYLGILVFGRCNLYFMESLHWIEVGLEYVGIKLGSKYIQVTLLVFLCIGQNRQLFFFYGF